MTFSTSPDWQQSRLYNERVYRLHRYWLGLVRLSKRFAAKKAGVEDGEINNQRKAFLDMLAWSEGTDNGRQKPEIMVMKHRWWRVIYWLISSGSPQTCHAKPKTQINARRTLPASFPVGGCLLQAALSFRKDFSESQDAVALQQIMERRFTYDWSWWYPSGTDRCSNIWLHCRALVMVSSSIRLTAWLQNSKKRRNGQRDWCMSRVTAIILPGYLHHRLPVMGR